MAVQKITLDLIDNLNVFKTVAVSGQNSIVADSSTDTLTIAGGDGITITTNDSTDTLTITAASSGDSAFDRDADFANVADSATTTEDLGSVIDSADSSFDLGTIAVQGIVVTGSIVDSNVTSAKLSGLTNSSSGTVVADGDGTFSIAAGGSAISDGTSTLNFNGSNQVQSDASIVPNANGTLDLGTSALRWQNIYTSDLNLSNGVGDYTVVEGEEDLFLYNNKSGKVFKFALIEVDPSEATPKIEDLKNGSNR